MKALLRLTLAVALLASFTALPSTAVEGTGVGVVKPGFNKLQCTQFCAVVLCAYPQTCGPYIDANGQPACGCHGSIREVE